MPRLQDPSSRTPKACIRIIRPPVSTSTISAEAPASCTTPRAYASLLHLPDPTPGSFSLPDLYKTPNLPRPTPELPFLPAAWTYPQPTMPHRQAALEVTARYCGRELEQYGQCVAAKPETWQRDCHHLKMSIARCTSSQ
uniref:Coiled-coil-helix-coiled-coil-helix domain containing 5 n=1 Tax=Equus asinus TaxID=9793 RepID=A0A9L0K3U3_EQUAS